MTATWLVVVLLLGAGVGASPAGPQGGAETGSARQELLATARDLYTTAAYEDALAMLDRLQRAQPSPTEARTIEQYRAYSLFALGRSPEAEKAIEAIIALDPTWELGGSEAPPRILGLFATVRGRALPVLIRERFAVAKALYADKKHDEAAEAFASLLLLLEHRAIVKVVGTDLADLQTLAAGFRDLAKAASDQARQAAEDAAKAAAAKAAETAAAPTTPAQTPAQTPAAGTATPSRATPPAAPPVSDPVLPPSIITQQIPRPANLPVPFNSAAIVVLDVLVDELGRVERATVRQSVNRAYEAQLLAAARGWRYTPATKAGRPVKYVKTLEITLTPR